MEETKTNKYLWLYLVGFFLILLLPLLNLPPWFSPPDWGKTIVFRGIVAVMLFLFIWQVLSEKKLTIKTSLPFWLLIALLGVFLLSTIFSLDRTFSFWGTPYRSGGFLNFAFYIIFAILAFLILRKSDWQKIWNFSLIVAIFVCIIAIFQQFKILSHIFIPVAEPWSTIGGSTFLAMYLLLLSFLALSLGIKSIENSNKKWFFYFPTLLLFIFVILITGSRAAYLGLIIGFFYFVFFYSVEEFRQGFPKENLNSRSESKFLYGVYPKKLKRLKILFAIFLILVVFVVYYLNTRLPLPQFVQENRILQQLKPRLSIKAFLNDPRFSVWKIASKSLIEKPIFGYGPENFSIAFDKYYDPSLPRMMTVAQSFQIYYDRAHSFLFDIGVTAGIPALIIYISLFAALFWRLQKIKKKRPEDTLICHGIQATFLGYLVANLFSFDIFSTYLISFLLIGFSLTLLSQDFPEKTFYFRINWKRKYLLIIPLFVGLCWFIWAYNIKPFQINTEINKAVSSANNREQFERAIRQMENILNSNTFLDDYFRASYLNIINTYIIKEPQKSIRLVPRGIEILKVSVEKKPTYTRYWVLLGAYYNILLVNYQNAYPELVENWKNEAINCFEKALQLSPKRQEIFIGWAKTYLFTNEHQIAEEKIQKCIDLNPDFGNCWWDMALINIRMNEMERAKKNIKIAEQKKSSVEDEISLLQLRKAYLALENYQEYYGEICEINYKLTKAKRNNPRYQIDLFVCYLKIEEFEKARELAEKMLIIWPEYREFVNESLKEVGLNP